MFFPFFAIGILLAIVFFYLRQCQKFWKNRGIPSTSPNFLFGDIGNLILERKPNSFVQEDVYKAFPDEKFVGFYEFTKPNLMIRDPELIASVLVKDFSHFSDRQWILKKNGNNRLMNHLFSMRGKQWKNLRSKLVTTFSTNKLKSMLSLIEGCAKILDSSINEKCGKETSVDIKKLTEGFTLDVIGCCIFGLEFNTLNEPESEYRKVCRNLFTGKPSLSTFIITIMRHVLPKLTAILKVSEIPQAVVKFFDGLLVHNEEYRKTEFLRRNDFMQMILDIRDENRKRSLSKIMSDDDLIDDETVLANVFIFYVAGSESISTTLSFCLYELALNPEVQNRLRKEVQEVLKANDGAETYDVLSKMTYAEMVISETSRKYTFVGTLSRVCTEPYQLPGTSLQLSPGQKIVIPTHALHHDEKYYPNPYRFDPDRFTPENIAARPPFTYMPFGDGPRMCLAMRFAKMELKLCIARLISKYEFIPCAKTEIPLQMQPRALLLAPKNGIYLQIKKIT